MERIWWEGDVPRPDVQLSCSASATMMLGATHGAEPVHVVVLRDQRL
jgi:hypothetical protein